MSSPISVRTTRPCPISGSSDAILVSNVDRHGKELRNVISEESSLIFVDPVPFDDTEAFYRNDYREQYKGVSRPKGKHVLRAGRNALIRFRKISELIDFHGSVLDAGSSSGEFVYLLKSRGFSAMGLEANEGYAQFSKNELAINVNIQPFSEFSHDTQFDAITMFHVLEHIENPLDDLGHLVKFLKPGGHLIIEVPNILYPNMAFRNKWHPGHLFSYCKISLRDLALKLGLKVIFCDSIQDGGNLFGVFQNITEGNPPAITSRMSHDVKLQLLKRQGILYRFNPLNYIKFFKKLGRLIFEKFKTNGKTAKEILDGLYS